MSKDRKGEDILRSSLKSILLIDDNPDDRALTVRALSLEFPDVEMQQIKNDQDFSGALKDKRFDLVITDNKVHWIDGLEVLRKAKEIDPD